MKKSTYLFLCLISFLAFTGCIDDEKDTDTDSEKNETVLSGFTNPVKSVTYNQETWLFVYADNKLAHINFKDQDNLYPSAASMTLSPLSFKLEYRSYPAIRELKNIVLNKTGCITSAELSHIERDEVANYIMNYTYNQESQIIAADISGVAPEGNESIKCDYVWSDGNIDLITVNAVASGEFYDQTFELNYKISARFEYGNVLNTGLFTPTQLYMGYGNDFLFACFVGLKGKQTKNIPSKIYFKEEVTETYDEETEYEINEYEYDVKIEYDGKGNIISIKEEDPVEEEEEIIYFGYDGSDVSASHISGNKAEKTLLNNLIKGKKRILNK